MGSLLQQRLQLHVTQLVLFTLDYISVKMVASIYHSCPGGKDDRGSKAELEVSTYFRGVPLVKNCGLQASSTTNSK
jgi:hypothetical protein